MALCFWPSDLASIFQLLFSHRKQICMAVFCRFTLGVLNAFLKDEKNIIRFFWNIFSYIFMSPTMSSKHGLLWACNFSTGLTVRHTNWNTHTHTHRMNHRKLWLQNVQRCVALDSLFMVNGRSVHQGCYCVCVCLCVSHGCELQQQSDEEKTN